MSNQNKSNPFLQLARGKDTEEILKNPDVFMLLTQIALRAKRTNELNIQNLKIGESLIGDFKNIGLTEQRYRTAKSNAQKWGLATFQSTNRGTIAKLTNSTIYNINQEEDNGLDNEQITDKLTDKQRTTNEQITTNNNIINKECKKYNICVEGLKFVLEAKLNKTITTAKKWHEDFKLLIEKDLKNRPAAEEDVKRAIQAIADNYGKEYFPVIQSASSFREKFIKIEAYLQRIKQKPNIANSYFNLKNEFENESNQN